MGSVEAISKLNIGGTTWDSFMENHDGVIDLSFGNFNDSDLCGRMFKNCDLSGAQFENANLDYAKFYNVNLDGVNLANASLIGCKFKKVNGKKLNLSKAVFRNCTFSNFFAVDVKGTNSEINSCAFVGCKLYDIEFTCSLLTSNQFVDVTFERFVCTDSEIELTVEKSTIKNCSFSNSRFNKSSINNSIVENFVVVDGEVKNTSIVSSRISRLCFNAEVENLDLSESSVKDTDLLGISPPTAVLLNTSFASCEWPAQTGRVTFFGRYLPSNNLFSQPIQDIKGVNPVLRREIGDAQFLVMRLLSKRNILHKVLFRIWGITSEYGQSLRRLLFCSLVVVVFFTLLIMTVKNELLGMGVPDFALFFNEFSQIGKVFLGFGELKNVDNLFGGNLIGFFDRILGFLFLGLWITIAASKFNKLSSY